MTAPAPPPGRFHSLLVTARIANLPSVFSNVWLGIALAGFLQGWENSPTDWLRALLLGLAGAALYLSGNFFNDWHDHAWDRVHRPERALPRGLFRPILYFQTGIALALGGVLLAWIAHPHAGWTALAILVLVSIYTRWHKRGGWTVIPMGLCRALLPVMGALPFIALSSAPHLDPASERGFLLSPAGGLLAYIAALSLCARHEALAAPPRSLRVLSLALLICSGLLMVSWWLPATPLLALAALLPFAAWMALALTRHRRPVPRHVSALLAGIPLLDWAAVLPPLAFLALGDPALLDAPFVLLSLLLPPLAFLLALRLQRVTAAT